MRFLDIFKAVRSHESYSQIGLVIFKVAEGASLVTQLINNLPAMWETWVQFLGWEDPLEKGMATHSSIQALRISSTV